jgi:hypothetical protein
MRGLAENIEIQVADGLPWQWRRICFTTKGLQQSITNSTGFSLFIEASTGFQRVANQVPTAQRTILETALFKGFANADWLDPLTAVVDTTRVTLKYDKTITIASGNEDGVIRKYKRWYPMNKTLAYNDDENGGDQFASSYSTLGKQGMGDYFVVDYFRPRIGSASGNQLSFAPQATLYWHEK